jgi:poly(3-hydroxybutyrate) depolymerase
MLHPDFDNASEHESVRALARQLAEAHGWIVLSPGEYRELREAHRNWTCGRWYREREHAELLALREATAPLPPAPACGSDPAR